MISSIPFGVGICFVYTSVFTYLVTAFKPMAAEALTGNAIMRTTFAAGFPLFSAAMYHRLGTVGATALLAGLMTVMAPLPSVASLKFFTVLGLTIDLLDSFSIVLDRG